MHDALSHPGWKRAMVEEMTALHSIGTWDLVTLLAGKSPIGCRWVYIRLVQMAEWTVLRLV